MLPLLPPAVYKCIFSVNKPRLSSLAVYHSPLDDRSGKASQRLPFPAWPAIEDSEELVCLPTLMRAVYFPKRGLLVEPKVAAKKAEEYLSRSEGIKPEISEQVIVYEKSKQHPFSLRPFTLMYLHGYANINNCYVRKLLIKPSDIPLLDVGDSADWASEVFMQAKIYGNLKNFSGGEEAFSNVHELGHEGARWLYSGVKQDELSKRAHNTLDRLATEELSREQTAALWEVFAATNEQITHIVNKYEPIEEIFATYIGMKFLPTRLRKKVKHQVRMALEAKNWYSTYTSFTKACDIYPSFVEAYANRRVTPLLGAVFIFEDACRILEQIDVDSVNLLHKLSEVSKIICSIEIKKQGDDINQDEFEIAKNVAVEKIDSILEQADIPGEVVLEAQNNTINTFSREDEAKALLLSPIITLIGRASRKEITTFITVCKEEDKENVVVRIFYESIRQQLIRNRGEKKQENERWRIVCPFALKGKPCCGLKEKLQGLYKRLPEEDREQFELPPCACI